MFESLRTFPRRLALGHETPPIDFGHLDLCHGLRDMIGGLRQTLGKPPRLTERVPNQIFLPGPL